MSNRTENSLRGRIQTALDNTKKLIGREQYSAALYPCGGAPPYPETGTNDDKNNWIKDRLELYVETWILPNLEAALKKVTKK